MAALNSQLGCCAESITNEQGYLEGSSGIGWDVVLRAAHKPDERDCNGLLC
jgi:hypothetical protein